MRIINEVIKNVVQFYDDETAAIAIDNNVNIDKLEKFLKRNANWAKVKMSNGKSDLVEISTRALAMAGIEYLEKNKLI